jgi:hypothetical protein
LRAYVNGSNVWSDSIDKEEADGKVAYFTQARGTDTFAAGDDLNIGIYQSGSASYNVLSDVIFTLEVVYDSEQETSVPTADEKLRALVGRSEKLGAAWKRLHNYLLKVRAAMTDEDIGPTITGADKDMLLAGFGARRTTVDTTETNVPMDWATFDPDPSEYEEEPAE